MFAIAYSLLVDVSLRRFRWAPSVTSRGLLKAYCHLWLVEGVNNAEMMFREYTSPSLS